MYEIYKTLNLVEINKNTELDDILENNSKNEGNNINNDNKNNVTCYDGPPSVSGLPGIHHILSRTLKDIFCRYHYL